MSTHNEIVPYRWTELDRMAVVTQFPSAHVTPYSIPASSLGHATEPQSGDLIRVPLGATEDAAVVERFFREGYEWVPLPEDIDPTGQTLVQLFAKLYQKDSYLFSHFDPVVVASLEMARAAAEFPEKSVVQLITSPPIPFADLSQLHFDYWGNTKLRFEVVNSVVQQKEVKVGPFKFDFPWFGSNPLLGLLTTLLPPALPAERNGAKLEYVLARKPRKGVPIMALPRRVGGGVSTTLKVVSLPPLHIELDGWQVQTLVPLRSDGTKRSPSKIRFRLHIAFPASQVRLEILRGNAVYYQETHDGGEYLIPGIHIFSWDGCDDAGVFDSIALKQNDLTARLIAVDFNGRVGTATTSLGTSPGTVRWVDTRMDPKAKAVEVTTYARFRRVSELKIGSIELALPGLPGGSFGSAVTGLSNMVPKGALAPVIPGINRLIPEFERKKKGPETPPPFGIPDDPTGILPVPPGVPQLSVAGDKLKLEVFVPPLLELDDEKFARHKSLILMGTAKYWTRTGMRAVSIEGEPWDVKTIAFERTKDATPTFLCRTLPEALKSIGIGDGSKLPEGFGSRSMNWAFMEGFPIIGIWEDSDGKDADAHRARTGAHEVGHTVLRERGGLLLSLTHKGTSTIGQVALPAPDGPLYVTGETTEIDIMKYKQLGSSWPDDWQERMVAAEEDVLGLIGLGTVCFG